MSVRVRELPDHDSSRPALFLGFLHARRQLRRLHESVRGVGRRGRLTDNELVLRDSRTGDLLEGGLGILVCGLGHKTVTVFILILVIELEVILP